MAVTFQVRVTTQGVYPILIVLQSVKYFQAYLSMLYSYFGIHLCTWIAGIFSRGPDTLRYPYPTWSILPGHHQNPTDVGTPAEKPGRVQTQRSSAHPYNGDTYCCSIFMLQPPRSPLLYFYFLLSCSSSSKSIIGTLHLVVTTLGVLFRRTGHYSYALVVKNCSLMTHFV